MNSIGAKHVNYISSKRNTYNLLILFLDEQLVAGRIVLEALHQFLSKYQPGKQSISEYVATRRADIIDCHFIYIQLQTFLCGCTLSKESRLTLK